MCAHRPAANLWILGRHRPAGFASSLDIGEEALRIRQFLVHYRVVRWVSLRRHEADATFLALPGVQDMEALADLQDRRRPVEVTRIDISSLLPASIRPQLPLTLNLGLYAALAVRILCDVLLFLPPVSDQGLSDSAIVVFVSAFG